MSQPIKTYAVPKPMVWAVVCFFIIWPTYKAYDWWAHVNWPPADPRNTEFVKTLNCTKNRSYLVTSEMLKNDLSGNSFLPIGIDRLSYIENPACAAADYLTLEGTGVRIDFNVYDMTTKRKTANIVITHELFDHK